MQLPKHIAFILDGNARWARQQGKTVAEGHRKGMLTLETILDHCLQRQIAAVTIYAFSTENWKRPMNERKVLFNLLLYYFQKKINTLLDKQVRIKIIGEKNNFPKKIVDTLTQAEQRSEHNKAFLFQVALSYGGRSEIVAAAKKFYAEVAKGRYKIEELNETLFAQFLDSSSFPDLLIRTGGEERISNFLLYQIAYSEFYFTKTLWPEFSSQELELAIQNFAKRERRFGGRQTQY